MDALCNCICHNDDPGVSIMHCMPCCDRTYEKFRDENGNLKADADRESQNEPSKEI